MSKNSQEKNYLSVLGSPFVLGLTSTATANIVTARFVKASKNENEDDTQKFLADYPYFQGKCGNLLQTPDTWYMGCGKTKELDEAALGEVFMKLAAQALTSFEEFQIEVPQFLLEKFGASTVAILLTTAFAVSAYPTDFLKKKSAAEKIILKKLLLNVENSAQEYASEFLQKAQENFSLAEHINGMRQVQALPGNFATPETIEKKIHAMSEHYGFQVKVYQQAELEEIGAGGIVAVGKGSVIPPRMISMEYIPEQQDDSTPTMAIVGKGVTFDTGGISLKPGSNMHEMKFDLSGAAATIHAVSAAAALKLPVRVAGVIGLVENMPDGAALKPGDVYTALNGTTVEVQNTDAEGRLVLGDLLTHAQNAFKPNLMVNLATLTGAMMVALGHFYAGVFSNQNKAKDILDIASQNSREPIWHMPMGRLYRDLLKSDIADYNNIGGRAGGSCSAASFLSVFVKEEIPWAHIDIAGIGYSQKGFGVYPPVSGFGIRLLVEAAKELSKRQ